MKPALIFDLDGTLIDSAPDIHAAANVVMAEQGLAPLGFDQVRGFIGNGAGILIERCLAAQGRAGDAALQAAVFHRFIQVYETAVTLTKLYPGVTAALDALAAHGYRLGLCTNKPEGATRAVLRHFDLARLFAVIIGGDTLPQRKPDPAPLLRALNDLGGGPALFVGDSEVDRDTALAADMPFALFTQGYRKTHVTAMRADLAFADHAELAPAVHRYFAPQSP